MKKIDFDLDSNPFINFQSARYSVSAKIDAKKTYDYSKENNLSFFLVSLGCILKASNKIPEFKRRIIDGEVIEFNYLDGVCPIMYENNKVFREMRVSPPMGFESVEKWVNKFKTLENDILSLKDDGFQLPMEKRDLENIINCSCVPWIDFDSFTNCEVDGKAIQPLITWGKYNEEGKISVSITVSHIFVNGRELGYFYQYLQDCFNKPQDIIYDD